MSSKDRSVERSGLARDEVVRAALQLLDEEGLDSLTMRGLAERLGVKAASLYWHLRDKEELAQLVMDAINSEIAVPSADQPWRRQLEELAWSWRQVLLKHRDAARLALGRFVMRPHTLRRIESVLSILRRAGFTAEDTARAAYVFSNFVPGFVVEETVERRPVPTVQNAGPELKAGASGPARLDIRWAKKLTIRGEPRLTELYAAHSEGRPPVIQAAEGAVSLIGAGRKPVMLSLNPNAQWDISVRGGASGLSADLRGLPLTSFLLNGGASNLELTLSPPTGTVPIEFRGGASRLTIHRDQEVALRLEVHGGISRLMFDLKQFRSAIQLTVQTPGYDDAPDRYHVIVRGGASRVTVDAQVPGAAVEPEESETPVGEMSSFGDLSPADYPTLVGLAGQLISGSMDDRFRFGVNLLLDGLEQRLKAGP